MGDSLEEIFVLVQRNLKVWPTSIDPPGGGGVTT
jgi:hypothetical protein